MGLFKRGHRIAEGGGGAYAAPSSDGVDARKTKDAKEDLGLFGADSDDSDDDATIDRYANTATGGGVDGEEHDEGTDGESKKVSVLLAKLSPEELFKRYDTDGSGSISIPEFLAMLPDLGIKISTAKAIRLFKKCDADGTGAIDLTEFKTALFAVDPVAGNTLGFAPSQFLAPRDAFELFDEHGTGQIDELVFADVLEYFGMDVSDGKQESLFKKYDKDKSGFIDYKEFRAMWIRVSNVRDELQKRGVEIPKYATPWKLQRLLEETLDQEEAREALVLQEAQTFLAKQRETQRREALGLKAHVRAQDELAAALDAAGQVYVLGTGTHGQFTGLSVVRDDESFPGFHAVSEIWACRVDPQVPAVEAVKEQEPPTPEEELAIAKEKARLAKEERARLEAQERLAALKRTQSRYVRRRPENKRWTFRSPPKLNVGTLPALKSEIRSCAAIAHATDKDNEAGGEASPSPSMPMTTSTMTNVEAANPNPTATGEELARLFYDDRAFVRSLRFQSTVVMKNTGSLWGRGVFCGALSADVALVVARNGSVFTWGGKNKPEQSAAMQRVAVLNGDDGDEEGPELPKARDEDVRVEDELLVERVTPRSAMVKMTTKHQLQTMDKDVEKEAQEERRLEEELRERDQDECYAKLKSVVIYYDLWEPPPSNATRLRFMDHVLVPRLDFTTMQKSAQWRGLGDVVVRITKMNLMLLLADCFALEREVKGESGHEMIKVQEKLVRALEETKDKKLKLQLEPEKEKMLQLWEDLRKLRDDRRTDSELSKKAEQLGRLARADATFEAMVARRHVHNEDLIPEFTARGTNARIELSGVTTRGPALHSPRGAVAVADIAAGGSHAAIVLHDGSVFTWGIGSDGRLGHAPTHATQHTFDSNHPQLLDAFRGMRVRQISCGFSHSAVVTTSGELAAWGSAVQGQLGVGLVEEKYEQCAREPVLVKFPGKRILRSVSCGAAHTGAVSTQGELFMWGSANGGRLGLGAHVQDAVVVPTLVKELVNRKVRVWQVACGHAHSALCTETTSELRGGSKKLQGGDVYVCGGAIPLGKHTPSWTLVAALRVAIRQVSCGVAHIAAVSAYGELYTWGRNAKGCTGHNPARAFIAEPELVRSLHVEPFNVARDKPCDQLSVYNEQHAACAVNGDVDGVLAKCIHTQLDDQPWWQVDLGQPAVIERIRVWNRTDEPLNPTKPRNEFTSRLFPFWILISEFPFRRDLTGKEGLRAAKVQASAFEQFSETDKRMTEWVLPTAQTVGQYVRIQLQNRNFLHVAEVEVFGVYSAFNYVGRVGAAHCGNNATLVVVPPVPTHGDATLDDYYLRAIQADADSATILRQFEAYEASYRRFGRGSDAALGAKCRLCRVFRACEICTFLQQTHGTTSADALPRRPTGDRAGLDELVRLAVEESALGMQGASGTEKLTAHNPGTLATPTHATPTLLNKVLPSATPLRKITAAFGVRKAKPEVGKM